jgi:hypothetical protein
MTRVRWDKLFFRTGCTVLHAPYCTHRTARTELQNTALFFPSRKSTFSLCVLSLASTSRAGPPVLSSIPRALTPYYGTLLSSIPRSHLLLRYSAVVDSALSHPLLRYSSMYIRYGTALVLVTGTDCTPVPLPSPPVDAPTGAR